MSQINKPLVTIITVVYNDSKHIRDAIDIKRVMFFVVIAMLPTLFFGMYNVGYQLDKTGTIFTNVISMINVVECIYQATVVACAKI